MHDMFVQCNGSPTSRARRPFERSLDDVAIGTLGQRTRAHDGGHAIVFFVMAIAAAEAAIGLAILIGVFRTQQTLEVDELDALRDET